MDTNTASQSIGIGREGISVWYIEILISFYIMVTLAKLTGAPKPFISA